MQQSAAPSGFAVQDVCPAEMLPSNLRESLLLLPNMLHTSLQSSARVTFQQI